MEKTEGYTEVCFDDVGTTPNRTEKRIEIFLLKNPSKKNRRNPKRNKKKQKSSREERNGRTPYGKVYFKLQPGQRYCIEETIRKKRGTTFLNCATVTVEQNGNIRIEGWKGNFCPQFSSTKEVIR